VPDLELVLEHEFEELSMAEPPRGGLLEPHIQRGDEPAHAELLECVLEGVP